MMKPKEEAVQLSHIELLEYIKKKFKFFYLEK